MPHAVLISPIARSRWGRDLRACQIAQHQHCVAVPLADRHLRLPLHYSALPHTRAWSGRLRRARLRRVGHGARDDGC